MQHRFNEAIDQLIRVREAEISSETCIKWPNQTVNIWGATSFVQNLECTTPCLYNISFIQHLICTKLGYTTPHLYKTHFYNTSFVQHLGYTTLGYTTLESTILINVSLPDISLLKLFPLGRLRPTLAVLQNGSI